MDGEDWDANFIAQLVDCDEGVDDDEADDDDMDVDEEPVHKYDRFSHVIKELDEIKLFLEDRGYSLEADAVSSVVDMVACAHNASMKQTTPGADLGFLKEGSFLTENFLHHTHFS